MARFLHKGMSCFFKEWGNEKNPSLILLHGFSQSSKTWGECAPLLTDNRRVFALDLIGYGESYKPEEAIWYREQEMHELLDTFLAFIDRDSCDLLGYSMGGRIALGYACKSPQRTRSLILESAGLGCESAHEAQATKERNERMANILEEEGIEAFVERWEKLPVFEPEKYLPTSVRKQLHRERLDNNSQALAHSLREAGQHRMPDYSDALTKLDLPVLYIAGAHDNKYANLAYCLQNKLNSDANIDVELFDTGHNVHLELPGPYCRKVSTFLETNSPHKDQSANMY